MTFTNNKFQTENIELKKSLEESDKALKESFVKNSLLRKALNDIQLELKSKETLQEQIDAMIFDRSDLKARLDAANDIIISLKEQVKENEKELALPKQVIIQELPRSEDEVAIYKEKYDLLYTKYHELVEMYDDKCRQLNKLDSVESENSKTISELRNSLENINMYVEKFRDENARLRSKLGALVI